jgi:hypothetical protein
MKSYAHSRCHDMNNVRGAFYYHGNAKDTHEPSLTLSSHSRDTTQFRHAIIERGLTRRLGDLAISGMPEI